jgi:hypothetical protein
MSTEDNPQFLTGTDLAEQSFFDPSLLKTKYFRSLRERYLELQHSGFDNPHRNYRQLLSSLDAIFAYNQEHARSLAKRFRAEDSDPRNGDAIFAESIVYRGHLPLIGEGYVVSLAMEPDQCDLIVHRRDGSMAFLEVFSVCPDFKPDPNGVTHIQTHTQEALSSVRRKLLHKIESQKQMTKARENWAVIELNHQSIAGAFTVLASLSGGYKLSIDTTTMKTVSEGFDWSDSVFGAPQLRFLRGVIHFDLGNYADRRILLNPVWIPPEPHEA